MQKSETRTITIAAKVTPSVRRQVQAAAGLAGLSLSEYVSRVLARQAPVDLRAEAPKSKGRRPTSLAEAVRHRRDLTGAN